MATQYPKYQMQDGKTRLGQEYFNPILQDLDSRLDKLEKLQVSWLAAIAELQQFGLDRIDGSLGPVLEEAQVQLTEASAMAEELTTMIAEADIPGQIEAGLTDIQDDVESIAEDISVLESLIYASL